MSTGGHCMCGHQEHVHFDKAKGEDGKDMITPGGRCRGRKCGCKRFTLAASEAPATPERWMPTEGGACCVRSTVTRKRYPGTVRRAQNGLAQVAFRTEAETLVRNFLTETMMTLRPGDWELLGPEEADA
jgi:hypothetical protein